MQNPHQQNEENTSRFITLELIKFINLGVHFTLYDPLFFVVVQCSGMARDEETVSRGGHGNSGTRKCGGCVGDGLVADITTGRCCGGSEASERSSQYSNSSGNNQTTAS